MEMDSKIKKEFILFFQQLEKQQFLPLPLAKILQE